MTTRPKQVEVQFLADAPQQERRRIVTRLRARWAGAAVMVLFTIAFALLATWWHAWDPASRLIARAEAELHDRHDAHAALVQLNRALERDPSNRAALLLAAEAHQLLGQRDKATMICRQLIRIDPDDADARVRLGILLAQQDRTDDAIAELQRALQLRPEHVMGHLELGTILAQQDDPRRAMDHFDRAAAIDPLDPRPLIAAARVMFEQFGDAARAAQMLARARRLDPDRLETMVLAAAIQFELAVRRARDEPDWRPAIDEEFRNAELLAREAVRLGHGSALAHVNLGKVLAARSSHASNPRDALDRLSEAIFCFERAAHLDQDDPEPPRLRALALRDRAARLRGERE